MVIKKKEWSFFLIEQYKFVIFKLNLNFHFQDKQSVNFNSPIVDEEDV
jgi:hypothetical protein